MLITSHDLTIEEINSTLGIKVTVNYFTMPQEPFAALVRNVTIENINRKKLNIQCVDGLPAINPYGLKDWLAKNMGRTVEAWMTVRNIKNKAPFYQLKVEVADTPQVTPIQEGNFYFAFDPDSPPTKAFGGKLQLLDMVVEAACVFGHASVGRRRLSEGFELSSFLERKASARFFDLHFYFKEEWSTGL